VLKTLDRLVIQGTEPLVARAMRRPRTTLVISFGLFALSLGLFPVIGQSLFPKSEKPMFMVNVVLPAGANIDATDAIAAKVESLLIDRQGIASVAANVGHSNPQVYYNVAPVDNAPNVAQLLVQLSDHEPAFKQKLVAALRTEVSGIAGARIEIKEFEQGPPVEAPVAYRLYSDDLQTLDAAAAKVEAAMKTVPGTMYVDNPLEVKPTDLQIRIEREKAGSLGISAEQVARTVRLGISGLEVGKLRVAGDVDDLPVRVTLPRAPGLARTDVFDRLFVDSPSGMSVPLGQLTTIGFDTGVTQIRHYDRKRTVTVGAFVQPGFVVQRVDQAVSDKLKSLDLGPGVTFVVAGEKESGSESFSGIGTIILITVFGFIGVLVLEFRSFKSLLIVLSVVPLGIIGALLALLFAHETFSFTATIGLIALTGIEVKNSLLFVDFANLLRSQGKPLDEAIREAGRMRFLPILLTSMTAIGGLIPLIAEYSPLYSPLALVLVGGILSSTLLARFVTPAVYKLVPPEVVVETIDRV
jgi:multidrug efflux pump subunit AcrB